jgi:ATP-dependent DNA helicase RecQ
MTSPQDTEAAKTRVLREVFGFEAFRPGQEEVIDALLAGSNVLAVMPTGAGKSLCFQVPAAVLGGLTVVVSPLLALMQDQVAALRLAGIAADTINSSRCREANTAAWRRVAAGETRILYMAPERLMTDRMLEALRRLPIRLIAVDEAHCISRWGPSFRPEYERLSALRQHFPHARIAALTATADESTRTDTLEQLFAGKAETFVFGFDRPNIRLSVGPKRGVKSELHEFLRRRPGESGIVYCLSRKKTEDVAAFLRTHGIRALPYHAGMEKADRLAHQNAFMTEPGLVMVATIAFGMGIDKPDIRFVFHADLPGSVEAYYQEIGRAGRDGLPAVTYMLYGLEDITTRRRFIESEDAGDERKRREHQRLDALIGYCETPGCRRRVLLAYFGDRSESCGNCDNCLNPLETTDGTQLGQKALSAIHRTGERYGAAHIIDVLRGTRTQKVVAANHDRLPTFGIGSEYDKHEWRSVIRQLVAAGFLRMDIQGYGGLEIGDRGRALLRGETPFGLRQDTRCRRGGAPPARKPAASITDFTPEQSTLFGKLKELRLRLAAARDVPAFVIFSDKSLADMVRRNPKNSAEFAEVYGVGKSKLSEFADEFLVVIRAGSGDVDVKG